MSNSVIHQLVMLPESITHLSELKRLQLLRTPLITLPDNIGGLKKLESLVVTGSQLTTLPDSISQLTELDYLYVQSYQLRELPPSLGRLTNLRYLNLTGNPLVFPPPDVVAQGETAILRYLHDYEQIQARQVLAMGAGGVGLVAGFSLLWRWKTR